jgi:hypothetical protein
MSAPEPRPELVELQIADAADRWEALGFTALDGTVDVGGVRLRLGRPGRGITGWTLREAPRLTDIDGLATEVVDAEPRPKQSHPNGATAIDHVVVFSPDFERTRQALEKAGITLSRIRDGGGFRQGFRRVGPAILELVEATQASPGPARFWGLVVTVEDLSGLADRLGDHLSPIRAAVQSGRHIATLRRSAGLTLKVAFMD